VKKEAEIASDTAVGDLRTSPSCLVKNEADVAGSSESRLSTNVESSSSCSWAVKKEELEIPDDDGLGRDTPVAGDDPLGSIEKCVGDSGEALISVDGSRKPLVESVDDADRPFLSLVDPRELLADVEKPDTPAPFLPQQPFTVPLTCDLCHVYMEHPPLIRVHLRRAHDFPCTLCPRQFPAASELLCHRSIVHPEAKLHGRVQACPLCDEKFTATAYKRHIKRPHAYACSRCQYVFNRKNTLVKHMSQCHSIRALAEESGGSSEVSVVVPKPQKGRKGRQQGGTETVEKVSPRRSRSRGASSITARQVSSAMFSI
jgi:uncharacterized C2H2 Zn-finger protein